MKVGAATVADAAVAKDFAAARAKFPVASPWKLTYAGGANLDLYVAAPALVGGASHGCGVLSVADRADQERRAAAHRVSPRMDWCCGMAPGAKAAALKDELQGVLVLTSSDGSMQALNVDAPVGAVPAADLPRAARRRRSRPCGWRWPFAFLGGLILNVMPCVLPILAMKALALAGHGGRERREAMLKAFPMPPARC